MKILWRVLTVHPEWVQYPCMPTTAPEPSEYVLPEEIADAMRVHKMTIYRLIHKGDLAAVKVGRQYRVTRAEFERFVAANRTAVAA